MCAAPSVITLVSILLTLTPFLGNCGGWTGTGHLYICYVSSPMNTVHIFITKSADRLHVLVQKVKSLGKLFRYLRPSMQIPMCSCKYSYSYASAEHLVSECSSPLTFSDLVSLLQRVNWALQNTIFAVVFYPLLHSQFKNTRKRFSYLFPWVDLLQSPVPP